MPDGTGFVFMGGVPRSGLTLLRRLLMGHTHIHCGPDTGLPTSIAMQWKNFHDTLGTLHKTEFGLAPGQVRTVMADLLTGLIGEPLKSDDIRVLVEKTSLNILAFKPLATLLPGARFVHVVRDGRDVAASLLQRDWCDANGQPFAHVSDPRAALDYWNGLAGLGLDAETELKARCLRLKYEDLARAPKRTLTTLLRFMDLDFDPGVFDAPDEAVFTALERDSLPRLLGPVVKTRIGDGRALAAHLTEPVRARLRLLGYRVD